MPFDATPTPPPTVWPRNAAGEYLPPPPREVEAQAEHLHDTKGRPFTRLTLRRLWADGGEFIANIDGHLPDGSLHAAPDRGCVYRLILGGRA